MTLHKAIAVFITFLVILIVMIVYACAPDAEPVAQEQLYQGVSLDEHLLRLDRLALEKAYEEHLKLLFSVWLKDDVSVVHRINTGLKRAKQAYAEAASRIEERERALQKK